MILRFRTLGHGRLFFLFLKNFFLFVFIVVLLFIVVYVWLVVFLVLKFFKFFRLVEIVLWILLFVILFFDNNLLVLSLFSRLRLVYFYFCGLLILIHEFLILFVDLSFLLFRGFVFVGFADRRHTGLWFSLRSLFWLSRSVAWFCLVVLLTLILRLDVNVRLCRLLRFYFLWCAIYHHWIDRWKGCF